MSNHNDVSNNNDANENEEEIEGNDRDTNEQQRTPRQRLLAKGKGDIIASSTRGPPKNDGTKDGDGESGGTNDGEDETKTLLWTICQKFRLHFIKANKLYKMNICRRVINHLLEDKKGSFWLKRPTTSNNDSTAEPTYVELDPESQLLLGHIRNVLDHIVFLSRLASGFKERASPSKKSSSSSSRRRTKTRTVTNKLANSPTISREHSTTNRKDSNHSVVPDEVASSPSSSASSPSSPLMRDRMGRGRRVRRPPQWKKLDGSDSNEEEEDGEKGGISGAAAANMKRSRPDGVSSISKAITSKAATVVSSNKRHRSSVGNSGRSKYENTFSATSSCSGSASSKSSGSEGDKKMVPGFAAAKKTSKPPLTSTLKMQSKLRLQHQPSTTSKNHKKRTEGEKRSSVSMKSAPLSKPRRRLYHPPTIPICWERMISTPLTKSSNGSHESESNNRDESSYNDTAMSKAMNHYVSVFGHAQIPPGWIGNVPLAHWASLQRQVIREWVHNYRKPTPQDYERLKPFLQGSSSIHSDGNEKEDKHQQDEKDGEADNNDDADDDSMLPPVAAMNTVLLWDGIVGLKVPHEQGEEEDKGFPLSVSLSVKGKEDDCSDFHPPDQKMPASYTPKPTTLAHQPGNAATRNGTSNHLPGMEVVPNTTAYQYRYAVDMEEDALVI
jgi:hypothetical protein